MSSLLYLEGNTWGTKQIQREAHRYNSVESRILRGKKLESNFNRFYGESAYQDSKENVDYLTRMIDYEDWLLHATYEIEGDAENCNCVFCRLGKLAGLLFNPAPFVL